VTRRDPLAGTPWSRDDTVAGFVRSAPNATLMAFAAAERARGRTDAADIGCGAGRNLLPLAEQGWTVVGTDLSWPMLCGARDRLRASPDSKAVVALAPMEQLPIRSESMDLIVAHGIWNLARSTGEFRAAVRESRRIARPGAALFVFTFSRHTIPPDARPLPGEPFVYTQFSGEPQVFLTRDELLREMEVAGFARDPAVPLTEHNRPRPSQLHAPSAPVIFEGTFRRDSAPAR
jgi:SAM-dependent methyltransferase